jgi:two-component system sensor histidine kinase QseC
MNSLTRTLSLLVVGVVLLVGLAAAYWSYVTSNHELEELFDADLAQGSRIVMGVIRHLSETDNMAQFHLMLADALQIPETALDSEGGMTLPGGVGHRYEAKLAFEIWTPEREALLNTLPGMDELSLQPGYAWMESQGFLWRTFTMQDPVTAYWIRSAQREDIRGELSRELALGNVLPLLLALPWLMLFLILAIRWGFRPLRRLVESVSGMAPDALHPLPEQDVPREVVALVQAINDLLGRLEQTMERERRFSSDAAHELRTPLTVLRLNLEQACADDPQTFNPLHQSVERMAHLVEQMLLLSRVDAAADLHWDRLDLAAILGRGIADISPLALPKGIEPGFDNHTTQAWVHGDEALLHTLFSSLLANAIQYGPVDSLLTVSLSRQARELRVLICDQGPGIPEAGRLRAMERFVRLDQRRGTGAGLGLAIAQRIVELHRGRIALLGRADGQQGLCVVIDLPSE